MAYNGVNDGNGWEDTPSKKTPRNAKNFNIMELGIKLAHTLITALQAQIDQLVINGDSSPAVAQALVNAVGKVFTTLKARLDDADERIDKKATYYDLDTQTGTALHFTNTEDAVVKVNKIEGATYQNVTTTGKNKFDLSKASFIPVSATVTKNTTSLTIATSTNLEFAYAYVQCLLTPNTAYVIKANTVTATAGGEGRISARDSAGNSINTQEGNLSNSYTCKFTTDATGVAFLRFYYISATSLIGNVVYTNIQLELGSTTTTFETFIPNSPSPDYPAPFTNAKNFDVVACGKNYANTVMLSVTKNGLTFTLNADKTITINGTATSTDNYRFSQPTGVGFTSQYAINLPKNTYTMSVINTIPQGCSLIMMQDKTWNTYGTISGGSNQKTLTFTTDTKDVFVYINIPSGTVLSNYNLGFLLEVGATATSYEPYKSNQSTISYEMPSFLNGLKDTIEVGSDGRTRYIQRVGKYILDGSININIISYASVNGFGRFTCDLTNADTITSVCTHLKQGVQTPNTWSNPTSNCFLSNVSMTSIKNRFFIVIYGITDLNTLKTFLMANPITILCKLATPIETIIPDIFVTSYPGITNAFNTANPQATITASAKSQLWWERRIIDDINNNTVKNNNYIGEISNLNALPNVKNSESLFMWKGTSDNFLVIDCLYSVKNEHYIYSPYTTDCIVQVFTRIYPQNPAKRFYRVCYAVGGWSALNNINADIVTTDQVNDNTKVVGAGVAYSLGQKIDVVKAITDKISFPQNGMRLQVAAVEAGSYNIPNGGYYILLQMTINNASGTPLDGTEIAFGYFGSSKRYSRTWAGGAITQTWTEF